MKHSKYIILIAFTIIIAISFIIVGVKKYISQTEFNDFTIEVIEVAVDKLSEYEIDYIRKYNDLFGISIKDGYIEKLKDNPEEFRVIKLTYSATGQTYLKRPIFNVQCNPIFNDSIEDLVIGYNTEYRDTPLIFQKPNEENGKFIQMILIHANGIPDEKILEQVKNMPIEINYIIGQNYFHLGERQKRIFVK